MYNYNRDLIYFIKREGTAQNPYNNITENIHVLYEKVFLEEIPVQSFKVVAKVGNTTLTEVARQENIRTTNQYYVNYKQGIVYFHSSKNNVLVTLTYKGQGVLLYPASRIYIDSDVGAGNVVKTLKDLIKEGEYALTAVQDVSAIINRAETALSQIETSVVSANNATRIVNERISEFSTAESSRVSAENTRRTSESARVSSEIARANAEVTRVNSETTRVNAENARISKEAERQTKETDRVSKETARVNAETSRVSAENTRKTNETARVNAETSRVNAEGVRNTRENERVANENIRIANENVRVSSEADRVSKELLRQSQESQRQTSFQTAIENVDIARANAENATSYAISVTEDALRVTLDAEELINDTGFKGEFDADRLYSRNNIVSYNGGSYIAVQDTLGNMPTNKVYWGELSKKGTDGIGSVASVNNLSPDEYGNVVITAESMGAERVVRKGVAGGYAGLDSNSKIPLSHIPDVLKQQTYVVLNEAERNALINLISGDKAYETSTGDSYIYDGSQWRILADADWENVSLEWVNIVNKPSSTVQSIDLTVLNSHTHTNKEILDKFSIVSGKLQYNGANIGNVDSINGMTGVVTITSASVGAYSKSEIDTIVAGANANINSKISNSEKGVANGVARLNASGKVVDASGNEVAGKVTSVNGAIGDITGLETTASVDAKINNHIENDTLKHIEILSATPRTLDKRGILFVVKSVREDISTDTESIDGGLFGRPYDEEPIDGGSFGTPYDEAPIDGGFFKPVGNIDSGLFTSSDDNTPIDSGMFTSLDDDNPIDGGTF